MVLNPDYTLKLAGELKKKKKKSVLWDSDLIGLEWNQKNLFLHCKYCWVILTWSLVCMVSTGLRLRNLPLRNIRVQTVQISAKVCVWASRGGSQSPIFPVHHGSVPEGPLGLYKGICWKESILLKLIILTQILSHFLAYIFCSLCPEKSIHLSSCIP